MGEKSSESKETKWKRRKPKGKVRKRKEERDEEVEIWRARKASRCEEMASRKGANGEIGTRKERRGESHEKGEKWRRKRNEDKSNAREESETGIWKESGGKDLEREKTPKKRKGGREKSGKTAGKI